MISISKRFSCGLQRLACLVILVSGLISCNGMAEDSVIDEPSTVKLQKGTTEQFNLKFSSPILIDNSEYVMYPLTVGKTPGENGEGYDVGGNASVNYWNIVFYNTATGEYHLLDDKRKMVILSHNYGSSNQGASSSAPDFNKVPKVAYQQVDRLIYYTVATKDYNMDNELNSKDPHYLFISDRSGKGFKQISPDNESVRGWTAINGSNKILIRIIRDSNGDKKFNGKDVSVPMVYDLNKNMPSAEIFDEGFKTKLRKQFEEQWLKN